MKLDACIIFDQLGLQPLIILECSWGTVYTKCQYQCCHVANSIVLVELLRFLNKQSQSLQNELVLWDWNLTNDALAVNFRQNTSVCFEWICKPKFHMIHSRNKNDSCNNRGTPSWSRVLFPGEFPSQLFPWFPSENHTGRTRPNASRPLCEGGRIHRLPGRGDGRSAGKVSGAAELYISCQWTWPFDTELPDV